MTEIEVDARGVPTKSHVKRMIEEHAEELAERLNDGTPSTTRITMNVCDDGEVWFTSVDKNGAAFRIPEGNKRGRVKLGTTASAATDWTAEQVRTKRLQIFSERKEREASGWRREATIGSEYENDHGRYEIVELKTCPHGSDSASGTRRRDYKIRALESENMKTGETMWLCEDDIKDDLKEVAN